MAIGIGGAAGSVLRYFVGVLAATPSTSFPVSTFIVNIAGCFLVVSTFLIYSFLSLGVGLLAVLGGINLLKLF